MITAVKKGGLALKHQYGTVRFSWKRAQEIKDYSRVVPHYRINMWKLMANTIREQHFNRPGIMLAHTD